jgi:Phage minor tail protein U
MSHARTQIRNAVATLLTGLPTTGSHVFKTRTIPLDDTELPALKINTNDEEMAPQTFNADPVLERNLQLTVIAVAKATDGLDDELDQITLEVEQAINATETINTLNGLVTSTVLQSIKIETDDELETPIGQAIMNFNVVYYTQAATPETTI